MSTTETRIPLEVADKIADWLIGQMNPPRMGGIEVVGSIRRRKPDVGDIEFIAPMPARDDHLFRQLDRILRAEGVMFDTPDAIGERVRGVHEGFKSCSFTVKPPVDLWREYVAVQVYRYTPDNRGWIEALRTGPMEFGRDVLVPALKRAGYQAREGVIWSKHGQMSVRSEQSLFHLLGMKWVEPQDRKGVA